MKMVFTFVLVLVVQFSSVAQAQEWIELFSGKDLSGWKVSENPTSFAVENGLL